MSIDHILKLARLEISEEEKNNLEKEFSSILDFVKKIEEIKINEKEFSVINKSKGIKNVMREDKQEISNSQFIISKKLIASALEKKDRYIKTKQIL
ncbi:MAG TPA: Asp-tRNA(Asn)/Glu-tRNA(Gln) amidotransferase subunit GatC [Candidatus Paceibacterota bacterium]|nr:Asp-tRNA(Asn)/Glu-tRNA(Gln) amidotransferase subunit GatC [Candidatus Paceibacterota bacterium]